MHPPQAADWRVPMLIVRAVQCSASDTSALLISDKWTTGMLQIQSHADAPLHGCNAHTQQKYVLGDSFLSLAVSKIIPASCFLFLFCSYLYDPWSLQFLWIRIPRLPIPPKKECIFAEHTLQGKTRAM